MILPEVIMMMKREGDKVKERNKQRERERECVKNGWAKTESEEMVYEGLKRCIIIFISKKKLQRKKKDEKEKVGKRR